MSATPNLGLELLTEAQDEPDVPLNYDLRLLDAIVQLSVIDKDLGLPPLTPADGDRYIVATPATGEWAGEELSVAAWILGAWVFFRPDPGWQAYVEDEATVYQYRPGSPATWASSGAYTDGQAIAAVESALQDNSDVAWDLSGGTIKAVTSKSLVLVTEATAARTVATADNGKRVRCTNASGCALTIPTNATDPIAVGFSAIYCGVLGLLTFSHVGVTVNRPGGTNETTRDTGCDVLLVKVATDEWDLRGDLDPV